MQRCEGGVALHEFGLVQTKAWLCLLQAIGWIDTSFVQALRSVLRDAALVSEGDISEALKALSTKDDGHD